LGFDSLGFCWTGDVDESMYRQVILRQPLPGGHNTLVTWLPEPLAVVGDTVRIRLRHDWSEPWTVRQVFDQRCQGHEIERLRHADIRRAGAFG
jgi:hypothetical protein